jgi:hypothetical protein
VNKYYVEEVSEGELRRVFNKFKPHEVVIIKGNLNDEKKMIRQISNPYIHEMTYELQPLDVIIDKFLTINDSQVFDTMSRMLEEPQPSGKFPFDLIVPAIDISLEYFRKLNL